LPEETILSLKNLTRFRSYLVDPIGHLKRKVIYVLNQVFPEYQNVFSNVFGKTPNEILLPFSNPSDLEDISTDPLAELLAELSHKKFGIKAAEKLSSVACSVRNPDLVLR